jgi:dTDP-4-dehydrorhamnose reductase/beta-phosphoglucomutase-like phosphatase (HAD superfamily)
MLLITGISGLLGRGIAQLCREKQIPYIGTYSSRTYPDSYPVDFLNEDELLTFLEKHQIRTCVHCVVERQVDICESDWNRTKLVNVDIVDNLARACKQLNIYLIHISTDYVFDGKSGANYPSSEVNPLQNYGMSKLLSEKRVLAHLERYSILRVPVLYTDSVETINENAVSMIGKKVLNQIEEQMEDDYSIRRPVFIPDFCAFILSFLNHHRYGIYHFYHPTNQTTKYKIANMIGDLLHMPTSHIQPISSFKNMANRPYDTELCDNQYNIHQYHHTSLTNGLARCFQKWMVPKVSETTEQGKLFLLMDLDGTLLDTDRIHYRAYKRACQDYGWQLKWSDFEYAIHHSGLDHYLRGLPVPFEEIKSKKKKYMLQETSFPLIEGAEHFLSHCIKYDLNLVIVTNTSNDVVEHYKTHQPLLQKVKQWITREDYTQPKPSKECYELAMQRFYRGESHILGFENTLSGYESMKDSANMVYFVTNINSIAYPIIKKEDIYLISHFNDL